MAAAPHPAALIDTDILIDAARGYPEASAFLREQIKRSAFRLASFPRWNWPSAAAIPPN
jgi:hypothetical protein